MKLDGGPDGLRSRGSPIMSRVLYQAELQAPYKLRFLLVKNVIESNSILRNNCPIAGFGKLRSLQRQKLFLGHFQLVPQ